MEGNQNGAGTGGTVDFGANNVGMSGQNGIGTLNQAGNQPSAGVAGMAGQANGGITSQTNTGIANSGMIGSGAMDIGIARPGMVGAGQMNNAVNQPIGSNVYSSGMVNASIASGSAGITIGNNGKKSKKGIIIGAVGVVAVALIVLVVIKLTGGFGTKATDLQSAFNIYANYFLTGEAKNENIIAEQQEDEVIIDQDEALDPDVENENVELSNDYSEIDEPWLGSYFYENVGYEDGKENDYTKNIVDYYDSFYQKYNDALSDNEYAQELISDYNSKFRLTLAYQKAPDLSQSAIFNAYKTGGESEAQDYVNALSEPFEEIEPVEEVDFYNLVKDYGLESIKLAQSYEKIGCFAGDEVDYDCVSNSGDSEVTALDDSADGIYNDIMEILETSEKDLYDGIFDLMGIVESSDNEEDFVEKDEETDEGETNE